MRKNEKALRILAPVSVKERDSAGEKTAHRVRHLVDQCSQLRVRWHVRVDNDPPVLH